jgi:hypothetical protein
VNSFGGSKLTNVPPGPMSFLMTNATELLRSEIAALKRDIETNPDPRLATLQGKAEALAILEKLVQPTTAAHQGARNKAPQGKTSRKWRLMLYLAPLGQASRKEMFDFLGKEDFADSKDPMARLATLLSDSDEFEKAEEKGMWRLSKKGRELVSAAHLTVDRPSGENARSESTRPELITPAGAHRIN